MPFACRSRATWLEAPGTEDSGALQHDLGCAVDARHRLVQVNGAPLDESRQYSVLVDSYDLSKDPTLKAYAAAANDLEHVLTMQQVG